MKRLGVVTSLRVAGVLATLLAVAGCGHSSDSTGPSASNSGASSTAASNFDFGSNNPKVVVAFGDSITFGVLEERRVRSKLLAQNNYPSSLQTLLQQRLDPAYVVINRGQPGEVVQDGVNRITGVLRVDRPGFILIMEGTNNASRCDDNAFIANALRSMVQRAKANKTIPVFGTIPPNFRNDPCAHDTIDGANLLIRGIASSEGVVLAEIFDGMNDRSLFGISPDRDPLHPNERGYQVMANIWFNAMKQAIPGGGAVALHPKQQNTQNKK